MAMQMSFGRNSELLSFHRTSMPYKKVIMCDVNVTITLAVPSVRGSHCR
jgi:hypothetical protein